MVKVKKLFTAKYTRTDGRDYYASGGYAVVDEQERITISESDYTSINGRAFHRVAPNVFRLKSAAIGQAKWMNEHAS